mmetsp:Transcript_6198/g.10115  ORF Transcript_6198/g.10115 Transcript_6198/m.10115 type:complete len:216 (+) Transcript_6198:1211-1858(+)
MLRAEHHQAGRGLQVEDVRRVPVLRVVHVALGGCTYHQVAKAQRHLHHAVAGEQQVFVALLRHVLHADLLRRDQHRLDVAPLVALLDDLGKGHGATRTRARALRAVGRPGQRQEGARPLGPVAAVRPARLVAQPQVVKGPHGEVLAAWAPGHGRDHRTQRLAFLQLPAEGVPHPVGAVFPAGDDQVLHRVPVQASHHPVVRRPAQLLFTGLHVLH